MAVDPATGAAISGLVKFGADALGKAFSRTKSKDRPIASADLARLVDVVRTRPFEYDEPAEFRALIERNRPGARQQIADALRVAGLSIFGPPPMLLASTAPSPPPVFTSPPPSGPFDPRLPVPRTPEPPIGRTPIPRGGGVAVAIIVLENLYREYERVEQQIANLEAETARMGETERGLQKRIRERERELRREQRQREREIRRRERELGRERKQLARSAAIKARRRITDVADVVRTLPGRTRPIARLPGMQRITVPAASVPFPPRRVGVLERIGTATSAARAALPGILARAAQAQQAVALVRSLTRSTSRWAPASGFNLAPAASPAPSVPPSVSTSTFVQTLASPAAASDPAVQRCIERARRPKQKRRPREVCYRGSYTETRSGIRKRKREQIPCE